MQHVRGILVLAAALVLPLVYEGTAAAASEPIVQELHVQAIVPHHRDIVLDHTGRIVRIFSNTAEDVRPTVYVGSIAPKNKKPLTDKLYGQYRRHVPEGTAAYGVLYERSLPVSLLRGDLTISRQLPGAGYDKNS